MEAAGVSSADARRFPGDDSRMRIESVIPRHSTVYFDADCAFCRSAVAVARAFDWFRLLRFMPLQSEEARELGLVENRDLSQVVLTRKHRQWGGWRAVKQILFRLPLLYCVVAGVVSVACLDAGLRWTMLGLALSLPLAR